MDWKKWGAIIGIVSGLFAGGYATFEVVLSVDARYAKAGEMRKIYSKVEIIELNQLYKEALNEYYTQKKLLNTHPDDDILKEQFGKALETRKELEEQLKEAKKQFKKGG